VADEFPSGLVDFVAGSQIASYRIAGENGRGGMAVVYRAHDVRLDRWVALKVLAPEFARDDAFRQRFIQESRAAAAVDHPNIIPIFDAGEAEGVVFIAMRYVGGQDAVVQAYYAAISAHDYRRAWRLGGDHTKTTWRQFVAGFRGTERDTVLVLKVSGRLVAARLTALQTDGTTKRFVGSYLVQHGAITVFNVRPAG
jgi:hypothetical protein